VQDCPQKNLDSISKGVEAAPQECYGDVLTFLYSFDFLWFQRMKHLASNKSLQQDFRAAKQFNKARLAALIKSHCGVEVSKLCLKLLRKEKVLIFVLVSYG